MSINDKTVKLIRQLTAKQAYQLLLCIKIAEKLTEQKSKRIV